MKKYLVILSAVAFLGTGCKNHYKEGLADGKKEGLADGRADGDAQGYSDGFNSVYQDNYDQAYAEQYVYGRADGVVDGSQYYSQNTSKEQGYNDGYEDHFNLGEVDGYNDGFNNGYYVAYEPAYDDGYHDGEIDGYSEGYDIGIDNGYSDGYNRGEDVGYDHGYEDYYWDGYRRGSNSGGYSDGYDDGYYAGYYSCTKSSNPSVKLAALVNNDLFDYKNLDKFDAKSALGGMGLSHAQSGTVDMDKLAALKEQHYLSQMGRQLQKKFGLSQSRSKKIAALAYQFNKMSGTRELTDKDAQIFSKGVIGVSLKDVQAAVEKSMKGESSDFNKVLVDIATHNETTPETINKMISEVFF